jgi:hypothetical protein
VERRVGGWVGWGGRERAREMNMKKKEKKPRACGRAAVGSLVYSRVQLALRRPGKKRSIENNRHRTTSLLALCFSFSFSFPFRSLPPQHRTPRPTSPSPLLPSVFSHCFFFQSCLCGLFYAALVKPSLHSDLPSPLHIGPYTMPSYVYVQHAHTD